MTASPDYSQAVADIIDGLGDSPTPDEVYHAVRNYSVDHVVAAAAAEAKAAGGGGGGSQPGAARVLGPFSFAFDTPNLNTGILTGYTLAAGDAILNAGVVVDTPFDGTNPVYDVGSFVGTNVGILQTTGCHPQSLSFGVPNGEWGVVVTALGEFGAFAVAGVSHPLKLVVSQTGANDGDPIGGTTGAARLYIVVATPSLT